MDAFTHDLVSTADNLREAHLELSTGLLHQPDLSAVAQHLDALEADIRRCHQHYHTERAQLAQLKLRLQPLHGFFQPPPAHENRPPPTGPSLKRPGVKFAAAPVDLEAPTLPALAPVAGAELDAVPRYLRGRLTLPRINAFLLDLNACLAHKYLALQKGVPARMPLDQRQRFLTWKADEQHPDPHPPRPFLTDADLKYFSSTPGVLERPVRFDQSARSMLLVLRQLGRIREQRVAGTIRYLVL